MAIMQERYVKITSGNGGESAIQDRDLNGLLFTKGRGWNPSNGAFEADAILKCYSVDQVLKYFTSSSDEVAFARKYFGYISPSGGSPASLSFARVKVTDSADDAILTYMGNEWKTSPTKGVYKLTFTDVPTEGGWIEVDVPYISGSTIRYTFVSGTLTSTNQVSAGSSPTDAAANLAAVINGTGGFFGQTASKYVHASVEGTIVILTATKAGSYYTQSVAIDSGDWATPDPNPQSGSDGGDALPSGATVVYETPADALSRVNGLSNNFGSFAFLPGDEFSNAEYEAVLTQNAGYNSRYLASVGTLVASSGGVYDYNSTEAEKTFVTAVGSQNGAAVTRGVDGTSPADPMAIFAAVDYNGTGTAPNFMYKRISGEKPSVFSDQVADTLDGLHVNYYGQTQANGQPLAFYQRGFNLDGEDTAVYCNEVWLKSHITAAIFNLLLVTERVPANEDGESMVYTTIAGAAQQGVTNGTIEVGKTYTAAQRAVIYQLTGDAEAYLAMQNAGYWLDVVIVQDGTDYKAVYKLVYGKGDSIRKVEGSDILM